MIKQSVFLCVLMVLVSSSAWGLQIVSPREGEKIEVGTELTVIVKPDAGEEWFGMSLLFDRMEYHPATGDYRQMIKIEGAALGKESLPVFAVDKKGKRFKLVVNYVVVLPSTTTVTKIHADFSGEKTDFPEIARKPNGDLVALDEFGDSELSISATYSDGVKRKITDNPDLTYKSLDEKVAIALPSGQWKDSKGEVGTGYALVRATGPGKTDIIVRYGEFTDRVTLKVRECPYIEGKMKHGCPR